MEAADDAGEAAAAVDPQAGGGFAGVDRGPDPELAALAVATGVTCNER